MTRSLENPESGRGEGAGDTREHPASGGPVQIAEVLSSLLEAVVSAKRAMDGASAYLARIYLDDAILRSLPLPLFTLPDVTVRLKFAVADVKHSGGASAEPTPPRMWVIVDLSSLEKLPPHLVSEVELRLTPQALR